MEDYSIENNYNDFMNKDDLSENYEKNIIIYNKLNKLYKKNKKIIAFKYSGKTFYTDNEDDNNNIYQNPEEKKINNNKNKNKKVRFLEPNFVHIIDIESFKKRNKNNEIREIENKADAKCTCLIW